MNEMNAILQPMAAMMLLTFVVWLRLYFTRVMGMQKARIHPQKAATRAQMAGVQISDKATQNSDHFQNLFEVPVLFYALCLGIAVTGMADTLFVVFAWAFVALRVVHAIIHLTYNKVMHRFLSFVIGTSILFLMVFRFAWQLT
ncbi:MAG: MAPEG family protein [Gammaproteobacteria bacterium]|nr:MAPEG family protein [Gammaproteobacteria bacterium]